MKFTIEKNVPLPPPKSKYQELQVQLAKMEIDDCLHVSFSDAAEALSAANSLRSNFLCKRFPSLFIMRRVNSDVLIWKKKRDE
jgi:hypothetical protein